MQREVKKSTKSFQSNRTNESHSSGLRSSLIPLIPGLNRILPKRKHSEDEHSSKSPLQNAPAKPISSVRTSKINSIQLPAPKRLKKDQEPSTSVTSKPRKTVKQLKYERLKSRIATESPKNREKMPEKNPNKPMVTSITNASDASSSINTNKRLLSDDTYEERSLDENSKSMRQLYSTADTWSSDSSD